MRKDPDDYPVAYEQDRDVICLDCGTLMAGDEREIIFDKYGPLRVCCNCGSGELEHRVRWNRVHDVLQPL